MVCLDLEGLRLEEMLEAFGRQVDGQELSVEGGVAPLGVRELLTVEGQRHRLPVEALLQHCPSGDVVGVVVRSSLVFGAGKARSVAPAIACLALLKAASASGFQLRSLGLPLRSSFRGASL